MDKIRNFPDLAVWRLGKGMVLGSCAELETHIEIAHDPGFIAGTGQDNLLEKLDHESKMLRNLIKRL
jgi:four helix bundle protein